MTQAHNTNAYLFGKVRDKADFLALGVRDDTSLAFERWLGALVEQAEGEIPAYPVRFLLAPHGEKPSFGLWVKSQDEVGRAFPLAFLSPVPDALRDIPFTLWLPLLDPHLDAAEAILRAPPTPCHDSLFRTLCALPMPHPSALPGAIVESRFELTRESIQAFASRQFAGGETLAQLAYALYTLGQGLDAHDQDVTLDIPCEDDFAFFVWCEVLRTRMHTPRATSVLLWVVEAQRAFVSLSETPDPDLLNFLLKPTHRSPRRWPLWTHKAEGIALGRSALSPGLQALFEADGSLSALLKELGR